MTTATLYAVELQRSYQNLSHSIRYVKSNLSTAIVLSNNNYVELDESTLNDINLTLDQFNQYYSRINEKEMKIQELLGGANITLACSVAETDIQEPVLITSNLVDQDNVPISNAKIELYANDRLAGTGTTDSNGTCVFNYVVPIDSKNRITFYSEYIPGEADRPSVTSNEVDLRVLPENTTLSMSVEPTSATFGDVLTVFGSLRSDSGLDVSHRDIGIYINDLRVGHLATNDDGYYNYSLAITPNIPGGLSLIHSTYSTPLGDEIFLDSSSNHSEINVLTQGTVLTLYSPASELTGGEETEFSGSLFAENGKPVRGEAISIYVGDHLLGTAVTGSNGIYDKNFTIPFDIASGTYPLYSRYLQESGKALTGSNSDALSVYLNASPLVVTAVNPPFLLFAGDALNVSGSVSTGTGKPVNNQSLYLNMSNVTAGEVYTDVNGSYTFSRAIDSNDSLGFYSFAVILPAGALSDKITIPAGQALIIPFDRLPVTVGAVLLIVVLGTIVLLQVTGFFNRIRMRREDRPVPLPKPTIKVTPKEPMEEKPAPKPAEKVTEQVIVKEKPAVALAPEPKKEFNLEKALQVVQGLITSGDLKGASTQLYMSSRHLAEAHGVSVTDSTTHREFYSLATAKYPSLTSALLPLINNYEKANFSTIRVTSQDIENSVNCLREAHLSLLANNSKESGK